MTGDPARMIEHIRIQARACYELGSPLYGGLLELLADDIVAGGPSVSVLTGHEADRGPSALALRLMGAVHRLVLAGRAPELAAFYPSVGGTADVAGAWPALLELFTTSREELRALLNHPPQTNEVGRAAAQVGGLHHVLHEAPLPIRLVEIGTSAGLNLRADLFRLQLADGRYVGPADSPVVLHDAWRGHLPPVGPALNVVDRRGCDIAPIDPTTEDGRLTVMCYVWPDQTARFERLRSAITVAEQVPANVVRAEAADLLESLELVPGTATVLWHSVMWQYLPAEQQDRVGRRIDELGARASEHTRFAHLLMEPRRPAPGAEHVFQIRLRTWPGGVERLLGAAAPHGVPTTWDAPSDGG